MSTSAWEWKSEIEFTQGIAISINENGSAMSQHENVSGDLRTQRSTKKSMGPEHDRGESGMDNVNDGYEMEWITNEYEYI